MWWTLKYFPNPNKIVMMEVPNIPKLKKYLKFDRSAIWPLFINFDEANKILQNFIFKNLKIIYVDYVIDVSHVLKITFSYLKNIATA